MDYNEMLEKLRAPFPVDQVHWRVGATDQKRQAKETGSQNAKPTVGIPLAYLDARNVMERLDEVCGCDWQDRYPHGNAGYCEIGIKIDGEWVWRGNGAGATDIEAEKGQYSDAFKRAGVLWGIGQYLYGIKVGFKPVTQGWKPEFSDETMNELNTLLKNYSVKATKNYIDFMYKRFHGVMKATMEHSDSVFLIKKGIADKNLSMAAEAFFELDQEDQGILMTAWTKGGPFTTKEHEIIKSTEFRLARFPDGAEE